MALNSPPLLSPFSAVLWHNGITASRTMPGLRGCDTLTIVDFIISVYQVIPLLKVVVVGVTNRGDTATQSKQGGKKI